MSELHFGQMGTGAITDGSQFVMEVTHARFRGNAKPEVRVQPIVSAETLDLWKRVAGIWKEVRDSAGAQIQLVAALDYYEFPSAGTYGFTKSTSASVQDAYLIF